MERGKKEYKREQEVIGELQENKTVPVETGRHSDHDRPTNWLTEINPFQ